MSKNSDWRAELAQLAEKLRDPFRMRMTVAAVAVAVMCLAISDPMQSRIRRQRHELNQLKSVARSAGEVMLLRDHFENVQPRIITGIGTDVVVSHLIDLISDQPVELMRIDAQTPETLGPLQAVRVAVEVQGDVQALMQLLWHLDADEYLIRVESIAINPPEDQSELSSMQLTLLIMKDEA